MLKLSQFFNTLDNKEMLNYRYIILSENKNNKCVSLNFKELLFVLNEFDFDIKTISFEVEYTDEINIFFTFKNTDDIKEILKLKEKRNNKIKEINKLIEEMKKKLEEL